MITFLLCVAFLVAGYAIYGKFVAGIFEPDDRETPAVAVNDGVETYLDESLRRFETVFPACGSSNSAIELSIEELEALAAPRAWVDLTKKPEPTA